MPRNAIEREADRLFLVSLYRQAGGHIQLIEAHRLLNERRASVARAVALSQGRSEEEAERAARGAELVLSTVSRDVRAVLASLQQALQGGAAAWLQAQIDDLDGDYERTFELEHRALEELERSRLFSRRRRAGHFGDASEGGDPQAVWMAVEEVTGDRASSAALLRIVGEQIDRRMKLRKEKRQLLFGKAWLEQVGQEDAEITTSIARALAGGDDDEEAAERVEALYQAELQRIVHEQDIPLGPAGTEFAALERLRLERNKRRFETVRRHLEQTRPRNGKGSKVVSVAFRVLPAAEGG